MPLNPNFSISFIICFIFKNHFSDLVRILNVYVKRKIILVNYEVIPIMESQSNA